MRYTKNYNDMDYCNFTNTTLSVKRIRYERGEALNSDGRKAVMLKKLYLRQALRLHLWLRPMLRP